jgi:hypothetical protein
LPRTIVLQSSFVLNVEVTTEGPPTIDGTFDFTFDTEALSIPITGTRIILFGFVPTDAVTERLSWKTDVLKAADGTEQRLALRRYPRQEIAFDALTVRDFDRNELNAFLFEWHSRIFGVPLWWDARLLTVNAAITDTTVSIVSTDWADFRVGGLAVVIAFDAEGNRTADTLEISAVSSSPATITFTSGLTNAYTANQALVVPVVPGILSGQIPKVRFPSTDQKTSVSFLSVENSTTRITPTIANFLDWRGKAVVDDKNFMGATLEESYRQVVTRIDNETGDVAQLSMEDRSTPTTNKRWAVETASRQWEIKSLLYALRGRQVSYFLPTFNVDMTLAAAVSIGGSTMDITNIGYTKYVKAREPFTTIAVRLKTDNAVTSPSPFTPTGSPQQYTPGQLYLFFDITAASEVSSTVEQLTLSPPSPIGFQASDVERIELMVLSRFDSDSIELLHRWTDTLGDQIDTEISAPVSGAYDS